MRIPRPIKKRRYSESPTRRIPDDKERIARERDKMLVGELGYGRTDSPVAGPSPPPPASPPRLRPRPHQKGRRRRPPHHRQQGTLHFLRP